MTKHKNEIKILTSTVANFENAFIAGGALTSVFTRQPINDYDLYFKSEDAFVQAVEQAYDEGFWCVDVSKRAVTFADNSVIYQMMHFDWFPTAEAIFDAFDFTCVMAAYDFDTKEIVADDNFLTHCAQRFLRFHPGTRYPLASAVRVLKYQDRGYSIGKGDMLKIALACRKVEINSWDDLKDQIGGAYGTKVMLAADGDFSLDAAISALEADEIWTASSSNDQPGHAEAMFVRIQELTGRPLMVSKGDE